MIDMGALLRRELAAVPAVGAIVGTRVEVEDLPPGTQRPAVLVEVMSTIDFTRQGVGHWTRELVNVGCIAASTTQLHALVVAVSLGLPTIHGSFAEGVVVAVELGASFPRQEREIVPPEFGKVIPVTFTCRAA